MKHLSTMFVTVVFLVSSVVANAQTSHIRLLTHGHKQVHESGVGISGWVVVPSITDTPDQWLVLAGPRYDGAGWNMELMGGAVVKSGNTTALIDARLELTPDLLGIPLYIFANPEWIATGGKGTFYSYLQADYVLSDGIVLIGAETENVVNSDWHDLSLGPNLVIPLGSLSLVASYQFHIGGVDQFWTRLVINL